MKVTIILPTIILPIPCKKRQINDWQNYGWQNDELKKELG